MRGVLGAFRELDAAAAVDAPPLSPSTEHRIIAISPSTPAAIATPIAMSLPSDDRWPWSVPPASCRPCFGSRPKRQSAW